MNIRNIIIAALITLFLLLVNAGILYYFFTEYQPMHSTIKTSQSGRIIWHGNKSYPEIALTFDDGPNSKATPKVLEILRKNDVLATFFVLGKFIDRNKEILKKISDEGHLIGNHTYTHASGMITDTAKIQRELKKTEDLITSITGQKGLYFRPPFGFENYRFLKESENMGHTIVLWTIDVADWNYKTDKELTSKLLKMTENGTIILLHDGGTSREAMLTALPNIITGLKKKGFKFVRIDEMIEHL